MLQQPLLLQAGSWRHENAKKTSPGSPCWERYCMRGHSSCLHCRGKVLGCLRGSFNQIWINLTYIVYCIPLSFPSVGCELKRQMCLNCYVPCWVRTLFMYLRELHRSFLKLQNWTQKKKKKQSFEKVGRQRAVARLWDALCDLWKFLLEEPIWSLYFHSKLSNPELRTSVFGQNNGWLLLLFLNSHEVAVIFLIK